MKVTQLIVAAYRHSLSQHPERKPHGATAAKGVIGADYLRDVSLVARA